jgi:hypothetical protein
LADQNKAKEEELRNRGSICALEVIDGIVGFGFFKKKEEEEKKKRKRKNEAILLIFKALRPSHAPCILKI